MRTLPSPWKHLRQGRFASQRNEKEALGVLGIDKSVELEFIRRKIFNSAKIQAPAEHKDHKILGSEGE